jgi:hypothetical protein
MPPADWMQTAPTNPLCSMSRDYNRDWRVNAALTVPKVPNARERHGDP